MRVKFPENGITSAKLPVLVARSKSDRHFETFDVNEHVACLMDEKSENGVVLGAIYSTKYAPPSEANENTVGREFGDGAKVNYNRDTGLLTIQVGESLVEVSESAITLNGGDNFGLIKITELVSALNELQQKFNALVVAFNAHTHGGAPPLTPYPDAVGITVKADLENTKVLH